MAKPTVRDIHDIVTGLEKIRAALQEVASVDPLPNFKPPAVPVKVTGLLNYASFIEDSTETLRRLIPEDEVSVEPETAPET